MRLVEEMTTKANHEVVLNHGGKRILKSKSHVPNALWTLILERSSMNPDVLFSFCVKSPMFSSISLLSVFPESESIVG